MKENTSKTESSQNAQKDRLIIIIYEGNISGFFPDQSLECS